MTPQNATVYAVYGQLFNLSGVIKSLLTGNAITSGLTGTLSATISKNDGSPIATANTPVEILTGGGGGTGIWTLDLSPTEMSCQKVFVTVSSSSSNALSCYFEIRTLNLAQFTGRWDAQSPQRFEQLWLDLFIGMALNGATQNGAELTLLNADGSTHFASSVTQWQTGGTRTKAQ